MSKRCVRHQFPMPLHRALAGFHLVLGAERKPDPWTVTEEKRMYGLRLKTFDGNSSVEHEPQWFGNLTDMETHMRTILQAARLDGMPRITFQVSLPIDKPFSKLSTEPIPAMP